MKIKFRVPVLLILLTFVLSGCLVFQRKDNEAQSGKRAVELKHSLSSKETKIAQLESLLEEKDRQLNEKDLKIKELRGKLEMFGVFDN